MTPLARRELLPGMLDMLVLKTLSVQTMHGYGIAQQLQRLSQDVIRVEEGSLYPALQRLEAKRWISAEWGTSENNRRARYYALTALGRKQLKAEAGRWRRLAQAVSLVLGPELAED